MFSWLQKFVGKRKESLHADVRYATFVKDGILQRRVCGMSFDRIREIVQLVQGLQKEEPRLGEEPFPMGEISEKLKISPLEIQFAFENLWFCVERGLRM